MATPRAGYRTADGVKIPSVTTILGRFKESGALIKWAYRQGRDHGYLEATGKDAPRDLYDTTQRAADIGTHVHEQCELYVKQGRDAALVHQLPPGSDADFAEKAMSGFEAFERWLNLSRVTIVECEVGLVSEKHRFGGTLDFIGQYPDGRYVLGDFKTSNAVYSDYLYQLAAYAILWEEHHPDKLIEGFDLLRFAKLHGDFAHHNFKELDGARRGFLLMRELYGIDQVVGKRA